MHSGAGGGGHLGSDSVSEQRHAVVARPCDFPGSVCIRPQPVVRVAFPSSTECQGTLSGGNAAVLICSAAVAGCIRRSFVILAGERTDYRHDGDVEEVSYSCTAEVGVRETDHGRVAVVVAGTPVPFLWNACRSELDESERNVGSYEHMAVAAGPDLRIDISCQCVVCVGASCQKDGCCYDYGVSHKLIIISVLVFYPLAFLCRG